TGSITAFGGGWNTLVIAENVRYGSSQVLQVPGIGELLDVGNLEQGGVPLMVAALFTLVFAVIAVDELLWKPLYRRAVERDPMALIEVDGVEKSFPSRHGTINIMQGITFDVADNDFLAIVGPSGSGKSTLLRLVQGLDRPTSGEIRFRGRPIASASQEMAMVF